MFAKHCVASLCITASLGGAAQALPTTDRVQAIRSFTIALNAPPDVATLPFGPVAEQGWDSDWRPRFVFPAVPEDREGAVFTIDHGSLQTWLLQTWDMRNHIVRYVAFDPGVKLSEITIRVSPQGAGRSQAVVTYRRTGLSSAGDEQTPFCAAFHRRRPRMGSRDKRLSCEVALVTAETLVARLESLDLQNVHFRHREHLEAAFFYIRRDGIDEGARAMLRAIAALAVHEGRADKFHATMTVCWIRIVAAAMAEETDCRTAAELISRHPALLDKELPLRFYSRDLLFSAEARRRALDPDIAPLPPAHHLETRCLT
jgi:hypothetical protein